MRFSSNFLLELILFSFALMNINRQINKDKRSRKEHSIEHRQKKIIHTDNYKYIIYTRTHPQKRRRMLSVKKR